MNLKLETVLSSADSLRALLGMKLPIGLQFKLANLSKQFDSALEIFQVNYKQLLEEYGVPNPEKPDMFNIPDERLNDFNSARNEMIKAETGIEISESKMISISDFGDKEIEGIHLKNLSWMIKELVKVRS